MKSFALNAKAKFVNFELQQEHHRYILSAQVQGNELAADELNSILAVSHTHVSNVSVVFSNTSKVLIKATVLSGNPNNVEIKVIHSGTSLLFISNISSFQLSCLVLCHAKLNYASLFLFQGISLYEELLNAIRVVEDEYSKLLQTHNTVEASDYNMDEKYKELTKEAIEAKALGIKKIKYYIRERTSECSGNTGLLERILNTPFQSYSSESIVLELETGVFDFPWRDVEEQKETIDLKAWNPTSLAEWQLDKVRTTIANHEKWVRAWVHGQLIEFEGGMMAQGVKLVKPFPSKCAETVALLLSVNTNLTSLRIGAT